MPKLTAAQSVALQQIRSKGVKYAYNGISRSTVAVLERNGLVFVEWTVHTTYNRRSGRIHHQFDWVARPLACTRCGAQCGVAEDVESCIDWGPAVIGDDGIVRPQYPDPEDGYQDVTNAVTTLRTRALCVNPECRHQWTLRRRFYPASQES